MIYTRTEWGVCGRRRSRAYLQRANELNGADQSQFALGSEMVLESIDDMLHVDLDIHENVENTDAGRFIDRN